MIAVTQEDAILRISINRPEKKNALTPAMYGTLAEAFVAANAGDTRAILIEGQAGIFCAGNDISTFAAFAQTGALGPVLDFLRILASNRLPVIAAVDGPAIGIGTTLLFHCDHVIASSRSIFATPFVELGLVPEAGSSLLAPLAMGHVQAFELLAMGRQFSAEEAKAAGLVSTVIADENVSAHALGIARSIAARSREAMMITRGLMRLAPDMLLARIEEEARLFATRLTSPEAQAAFQAFLAKAKP
jgi:enoyl-CoA hydratase/carnithine racemase